MFDIQNKTKEKKIMNVYHTVSDQTLSPERTLLIPMGTVFVGTKQQYGGERTSPYQESNIMTSHFFNVVYMYLFKHLKYFQFSFEIFFH